MSFDDLKDAWDNEKTVAGDWQTKKTSAVQSATVLARLRRNMRIEFYSQTSSYALLTLIYVFLPKTSFSFLVVAALTVILLTQGIYYYSRFYRFYRDTDRFDVAVSKNLRRIVSDLELNLGIYKTFSICSAPVATLAGLFIFAGPLCSGLLRAMIVNGTWPGIQLIIWLLLTLLITGILLIFFINLHARLQYGRYTIELKIALKELED